jgi:hypothetical protein
VEEEWKCECCSGCKTEYSYNGLVYGFLESPVPDYVVLYDNLLVSLSSIESIDGDSIQDYTKVHFRHPIYSRACQVWWECMSRDEILKRLAKASM